MGINKTTILVGLMLLGACEKDPIEDIVVIPPDLAIDQPVEAIDPPATTVTPTIEVTTVATPTVEITTVATPTIEVVTSLIGSNEPLSTTTEEVNEYTTLVTEIYSDGQIIIETITSWEDQLGVDGNKDGDRRDYIQVVLTIYRYDDGTLLENGTNFTRVYTEVPEPPFPGTTKVDSSIHENLYSWDGVDFNLEDAEAKILDFLDMLDIIGEQELIDLFLSTRIYFKNDIPYAGLAVGINIVVRDKNDDLAELYILLHELAHVYEHHIILPTGKERIATDLYHETLEAFPDAVAYWKLNPAEFFAEMFTQYFHFRNLKQIDKFNRHTQGRNLLDVEYYDENIKPFYENLFN